MHRGGLLAGLLLTLLIGTVAAAPVVSAQEDAFADVLVDDIVIGESEQQFGPMRAAEFTEDVDELVIEIDLGILETHGVEISDAEVDITSEAIRGATIASATVENGLINLVFVPHDSNDDNVIKIEEFHLTGLDTSNAEPASDLEYPVEFSEGQADVDRFDIVDPETVIPTVEPERLFAEAQSQRVTIKDIRPTRGNVSIELDVTVLESHGVTLDDLSVEVDADGGMVLNKTSKHGIITAVIAPSPETVLFDVRIELRGLDTSGLVSEDRIVATDVTYAATIEGDGADDVDVRTFDIAKRRTVHSEPLHTTPAIRLPGVGPAVAVIGLVLLALLMLRRH